MMLWSKSDQQPEWEERKAAGMHPVFEDDMRDRPPPVIPRSVLDDPVGDRPVVNSATTSDPLIAALIGKLPLAGAEWPVEQRVAWLRLMIQAFELNYGHVALIEVKHG